MKEERIWILLSRKLAGEISIPEQQELNELLETQAVKESYLAAWPVLKNPDIVAAEDDAALDSAGVYWEKQQEFIREDELPPNTKRHKSTLLWLAAACVVLLLAFFISTIPQPSIRTIEKKSYEFVKVRTGANEKKTIVLPDSSRLTLNENSYFSYDKDLTLQGNRVAHLSGEGYFEITHNPEAPFLIKTPRMDIRVMGTTFNLLASADRPIAEATLFKGKIEVTLNKDEKNERTVVLRPEEKLTLSTGLAKITSPTEPTAKWEHTVQYTVSEIAKPPEENLYKENAWVCGKVVFENDSLEMVAAYLEKKYGVRILFHHPDAKKSRLRGVFKDESLQSILEALKFIHAFKDYEINGSTVTIY